MGRAIYTHELADPDFSWLINSFQENNPEFIAVQTSGLPVVFVRPEEEAATPAEKFKEGLEIKDAAK